MVAFTTSVSTNSRIDMSDPLLVDFNRLDESGQGGLGTSNFSWFTDTDSANPPYAEVDINGSGFTYLTFSQELSGGTISDIVINLGNDGGFDIVITDCAALVGSNIDKDDPRKFWNEVLKGDDTFDLQGLDQSDVGLGVNVIFGDDLSSAAVNGNPVTPTDQGGNDTITGGDNEFTLIGDVHSVAGFVQGEFGEIVFRALYDAGNDSILSGVQTAVDILVGDAYAVGLYGTLNGGDDTISGTQSTIAGDAYELVDGAVDGGEDIISFDVGRAAGDVYEFFGGTLTGGRDTINGVSDPTQFIAGDVFLIADDATGAIVGGDDFLAGNRFATPGESGASIAGDIHDALNPGMTLQGGDDNIVGSGADDYLYGEVTEGLLADVSGGNDSIFGEGGNDIIFGQTGNDLLNGGDGDDLLHGGKGRDTVSYSNAEARVVVDLSISGPQTTMQGDDTLVSIENAIGSRFNDRLIDSDGANAINGGRGNDSIYVGAGNDTLTGGAGKDWVLYSGVTGAIKVDLSAGTATGANIGSDSLTGIENIFGGFSNDTVIGNGGANQLDGSLGNDVINGKGGGDKLVGAFGNDRLVGDTGRDKLFGEEDDDQLLGGGDIDTLNGGDGLDTLNGGADNDQLTGGAARDTFTFGPGSGVDIIADFFDTSGPDGANDDRIDLRAYNFATVGAIGKVASGDNLILNLGGGNTVTLTDYLLTHTANQINNDILI